MTHPRFEHFEHVADIGVRGYGSTLAEAFEQAALALTAVITTKRIAEKAAIEIEAAAPDPEILLLEFLNAIVYEMATRRMIFGRFEVETDGKELKAAAFGETLDPHRHEPAVEVKGATLTELRVAQADGGYVAQCVVDV
jgi:SHS2 domain-containing protein